MPPLDTKRCLGGMQTAKGTGRDSIRVESFSQVICIHRDNMEGERDPASQFQFSSPVQGFLGLCISSLRSSVDKSRFALKMGMGTVSCSKELQNRRVSSLQQFTVREEAGVCSLSCLWFPLSPSSTYCR